MSLWSRVELRIGVAPDRLVVARDERRISRAFRCSPLSREVVEVSLQDRADAPSWRAPIDRLGALLTEHQGARVTLVLSNRFVRYLVIPADAGLSADSEWLAYARQAFVNAHGALAAGWAIRCASLGRRRSRVASAIDEGLVQAITALGDRARIVSVQPYLMAAFNARRQDVPESFWMALDEERRLTLALVRGGDWKAVLVRQSRGELGELVDREAALLDGPRIERIRYVGEDATLAADARKRGAYAIEDVTLATGDPLDARRFAMALAA